MNSGNVQQNLRSPILWATFILYVVVAGYTIAHHELWGDELHSWNIAKASNTFADLIHNTRYEGHPPVWYVILWIVTKFTRGVLYMQLVHGAIAALIAFIVLFFSPFALLTRVLIPFGYYFLYEYAVLSRNYAIAVLIVLCICVAMHKDFKFKLGLYYLLLFLLANTHLLAIVLAGSVHLYFLLLQVQLKKRSWELALHALSGTIIFLSSLYLIFPPSDSELNTSFWLNKWNIHQVKAVVQMPLRAFIPIPAWWLNNFWNTEFLVVAKDKYGILSFINSVIVLLLIGIAIFVLRKSKNELVLFATNMLATFALVVTLFAFATARYSGFVFIGFLVAYWLSCYRVRDRVNDLAVNVLLTLQLLAGAFITIMDMQRPFSNAYQVNELLRKIPPNEKAVTDYWTLNIISAYADKPFYCIDVEKEISFLQWGSDITAMRRKASRYYEGIRNFFQREGVARLYLLSTQPLINLLKTDPKLSTLKIALVDKREGAIEKGSNLYLYEINNN